MSLDSRYNDKQWLKYKYRGGSGGRMIVWLLAPIGGFWPLLAFFGNLKVRDQKLEVEELRSSPRPPIL